MRQQFFGLSLLGIELADCAPSLFLRPAFLLKGLLHMWSQRVQPKAEMPRLFTLHRPFLSTFAIVTCQLLLGYMV